MYSKQTNRVVCTLKGGRGKEGEHGGECYKGLIKWVGGKVRREGKRERLCVCVCVCVSGGNNPPIADAMEHTGTCCAFNFEQQASFPTAAAREVLKRQGWILWEMGNDKG